MTTRKGLAAGIAAGALMLSAEAARAEPATWALDPEHTTIAFMVSHIGYANTLGLFRELEGEFTYDPETQELGTVSVVIDAASVWTDTERRDEHVRNDDFLNVSEHPAITFTANGGEVTGENTGQVTGDLTILGETHPITLDVTLNKRAEYPFGHEKETLGVSARGTVVRSRYGMDYAVANGLVGDEVELLIEFEAIRQD
jgi:polyisoprenoid-binding protein YceI